MHAQLSHSGPLVPLATARAAASAPVRAALRIATHAVHMRMHGLERFQAIREGRLPRHDYLLLIQSLLVYHSAIAAAAERCGCASLSSGTRRQALLRADLRALGGAPLQYSIDWQPRTSDEALGALYAAEGSMLGGRVIAGQLDYLFGLASEGRSFFTGSSDDGAGWRKLLSALESRCGAPQDCERAVAGALFSFELFEQCVTTHEFTLTHEARQMHLVCA